ncbi:MAG: Asp/Glu racemase, partial [Burkholderiaceae bacterium]|nr:Asp/Glu racemase [Burkholderiaceae bacterium]
GRFAIVTGGTRWGPMLQRLAQALGHAPQLAGIHTVLPTGAQLTADPVAARALLAQACRDVVRQMGVQAVILGGAGLAGMAAAIQPQVSLPVIDSVVAGTTWALRSHPAPPERSTPGFDVAWQQLSPELTALGLAGH